ncbi:hypothetical protein BH23CHL5_BH23CHL5_15790 [soil metagenome]
MKAGVSCGNLSDAVLMSHSDWKVQAVAISRRILLGGMTSAAVLGVTQQWPVTAQDGTPVAVESASPVAELSGDPGFAIARVRALPSAELNEAIVPHVLHRFFPTIEVVPGFRGYVFANHYDDPAATITLTLTDDDSSASASDDAAQGFVDGLDPRFTVETPMAERGPLRIFRATDRGAEELPPFLNGCQLTIRNRVTAPDADIEAVIALASEGLVPMLAEMDGFVMYVWMQIEGGRVAINIWETTEQLAAGDAAVSEWVAQNTVNTTVGDPIVNSGPIIYASMPGIV